MKNVTLEQVFEILDKKFELAFARENTIVMEVITDIKDQLLDIVEN